jgi:hypothetical protein
MQDLGKHLLVEPVGVHDQVHMKVHAAFIPLPLPLNLRPLAGGYFFLLEAFLAAGFLALDFCCFDLADLLAIMLLVFWSLTSLRHVSFPAEEPSMAAGAAAVNHRGEVIGRPNDPCTHRRTGMGLFEFGGPDINRRQ